MNCNVCIIFEVTRQIRGTICSLQCLLMIDPFSMKSEALKTATPEAMHFGQLSIKAGSAIASTLNVYVCKCKVH